jgi:hypothetical protein
MTLFESKSITASKAPMIGNGRLRALSRMIRSQADKKAQWDHKFSLFPSQNVIQLSKSLLIR